MRRIGSLAVGVTLLAVACTDTAPVDSPSSSSVTTTIEGATSTVANTSIAPTSSSASPPATSAPSTTTAAPGGCPELFRNDGPDSEFVDVVLAAWNQGTGEQLWEIPLGTRLPSWGVWSDEVVLGFPDGQLVGIGATHCDSWSITVAEGIDDLWITDGGTMITRSGSELAGFSGDGFGNWRLDPFDSVFRLAAENAGISVFVDPTGDLIGLQTGGGAAVFEWGGASDAEAVTISETFVYRSTGAEIAARPAAGGAAVWTVPLGNVDSLFAVPGTLLAHGGGELHAIDPQTGEVRWRIPFPGEVAGPVVLDHNELHLASLEDSLSHTLWHLDPADGGTVFRGDAPAGKEWFSEMDDGLLLEVGDDGVVRGLTMLQREAFRLSTGADRVSRFTSVELARGAVVVTLSFSAERF